MSVETSAVAVVGATGYVGQKLCPALARAGFDVTAVCSPQRAFLVERLGVRTLDPAQRPEGLGFPAVINLAYPNSRRFYRHLRENGDIVNQLQGLVRPGGVLLHTSTLAVFGMDLDQPIQIGPVPRRRDIPYVESKIDMEYRLMAAFPPPTRLHMVRLGNVWGPGSPVWTAQLAQRLVEGRPVGVQDEDGYSNCTDVANIASYLMHLLRHPGEGPARFHHLSEFSEVHWGDFVTFLAQHLGAQPVRVAEVSRGRPSLVGDVAAAIRSLGVASVGKQSVKGPQLGSWIRGALNALPDGVIRRLEAGMQGRARVPASPLDPASAEFLRLLSCPRRFASSTDPGWSPEVDLAESQARVLAWMREAGFGTDPGGRGLEGARSKPGSGVATN